jgi:DNA-nicking Smr family endonuclease|tara:strand:- start:494 stop:1045 length:552 start_codon:yes stop_codon:yes gene_type:complete
MERKLQKNELALWKEITKDDIKINDYISEEMTQKKNISIKKRNLILKKHSDINKEKNNLVFEKTELKENTFQVNKRMKAKLGRGLIRPEATLDLHGYNRVEAEKTLKVFINTCINQEKRCILIVTGKRNTTLGAKSILRELVPSWLDSEMLASLVLAHNYAIKKDGGDGARYVLLRKKRLLNE